MTGHWTRQSGTLGLLLVLLVVVVVLLPLLGAPVFLMQAGGWVAAAMLVFLGLQFLIFRVLDLRSRADEREEPGSPPTGDEAEWRAWRG